MKWIYCPTCNGETRGSYELEYGFVPGVGEEPCPTCTDSDGKLTGRVCVMSDGELRALVELDFREIPEREDEPEWG
jgi:hypothetical protein